MVTVYGKEIGYLLKRDDKFSVRQWLVFQVQLEVCSRFRHRDDVRVDLSALGTVALPTPCCSHFLSGAALFWSMNHK
jgi:hypothetical protein